MVYSSDAEHPNIAHGHEYDYLDFIRGSNLLIFDAPYTFSVYHYKGALGALKLRNERITAQQVSRNGNFSS